MAAGAVFTQEALDIMAEFTMTYERGASFCQMVKFKHKTQGIPGPNNFAYGVSSDAVNRFQFKHLGATINFSLALPAHLVSEISCV